MERRKEQEVRVKTIYMIVDKNHKEDDVLELLESLGNLFGKEHVKWTEVLAVETDLPCMEKLLKSVKLKREMDEPVVSGNGKKIPRCPDCGAKVYMEGNRCTSCARRKLLAEKAAKGEISILAKEEEMT